MWILVINSGSSSIKFQLIDMPSEAVLCKGFIERIGFEDAKLQFEIGAVSKSEVLSVADHERGLESITNWLMNDEIGILKNPDEVSVVAHRVVHGGSQFDKPTKIDSTVLGTIEALSSLAPLHNPANSIGIRVSTKIFKKAAQIAVFDTAFHQTLPEEAYRYAIPKALADKEHIRVYGFHGTSHKYVSERAMSYLKNPSARLISVHLGNGCSVTAIKNGKSMDHSLGLGPSNGLIMGTRSGDIDQSVIFHLIDRLGLTSNEVNQMLNKDSGLLGLTGYSDVREIQKEAENGNLDCQLALRMVAYRIKKYIGAYVAALNGLDALIFTAGIGENSSVLRDMICEEMDFFGIRIDSSKNEERKSGICEIQKKDTDLKILVIPTNEEIEIAKQAFNLVSGSS